jgi:hypothetical protein
MTILIMTITLRVAFLSPADSLPGAHAAAIERVLADDLGNTSNVGET